MQTEDKVRLCLRKFRAMLAMPTGGNPILLAVRHDLLMEENILLWVLGERPDPPLLTPDLIGRLEAHATTGRRDPVLEQAVFGGATQ